MSHPPAYVDILRPAIVDVLDLSGAEPGVVYQITALASRDAAGSSVVVSDFQLNPDVGTPAQPNQAQLMALWNRVVRYRDEFELTCSESIHQMDGPQIAAAEFADDLVQIVGFLKSEDLEDDE